MLKYFKLDAMVTVVGLALAFLLGVRSGNGFSFLLTAAVLAVLEVSLSFDNSIINAKVLKTMDDKWKHRFLTWGMIIAVGFMRILFPLIIVMVAGKIGMMEAIDTALTNPNLYESIMKDSHITISAFGGAFLAMVTLRYFFDQEKEIHWFPVLEKLFSWLGKIEGIDITLVLITLCGMSLIVPAHEAHTILVSGLVGLVIYLLVDGLGGLLEVDDLSVTVAKSGIASFLYLEVLDASFSLDGVISSFVITNNFWLMAVGLGIGAIFIRSLTLLMVDKGTIDAYKYLEPAAFYSIGLLTVYMFLGMMIDIPELVTGLSSVGIIGLGVIHSIIEKKMKGLNG